MEAKQASNGTWVFCILGIGLLLLILLMNLPSLGSIRTTPHAVERHGTDAINARAGVRNCKVPKTKLCPGKQGGYGLTVVFWCETGGHLCPGFYTTIGGVEKTAFMRPCAQWARCQ